MSDTLILASNSPRRQQLMRDAGLSFKVRVLPVDEEFPEDLPAKEVAEYLAIKKGKVHQESMQPNEIVITADTTVILEDRVLNKPENEAEALRMLECLSGKQHQVITGVCITFRGQQKSFSDVTQVYFRQLDKSEITYYIKHYRPFDKAGAYAIQEWIGMVAIERIEGSYFNVVGLPMEKLLTTLKKVTVTPIVPH